MRRVVECETLIFSAELDGTCIELAAMIAPLIAYDCYDTCTMLV